LTFGSHYRSNLNGSVRFLVRPGPARLPWTHEGIEINDGRDPSILKYNGRYYIAYTVQSWTANSTYFNIASSTNLTTWTNIASVSAGIANTKYTWAPEFYVEGSSVKLIVSVAASTCSSCFRP
jgi:predicted GH43/DUF377 family glycosyl hydrolase